MGRDKALLQVPGEPRQTLLDRACNLARELLAARSQDPEAVYVSGNYPGYKTIMDIYPSAGPLGALHASISLLGDRKGLLEYLLFIPVDMPALDLSALNRLIEQSAGWPAVHFKTSVLPLLLACRDDIFAILSKQLDSCLEQSSCHSVKSFLRQITALEIELAEVDESKFMNVNTPDEFSSWSERSR